MVRLTLAAAILGLLFANRAGAGLSIADSSSAMDASPRMSESGGSGSIPDPRYLAGHLGSDMAQIERAIQDIWSNVRSAAQSGDIDRLLTYFAKDQQEKYRYVFADLGPDKLAQSIGSIEMVHLMSVSDYWAEAEAIRTEHGEKFSYPMSFIKERGETWKVQGF